MNNENEAVFLLGRAAAMLAVAVSTSGPVLAQSVSQATIQLEEVVITARRMVEDLQRSPVAVTTFDESGMERRGMDTIADIGKFTPSMQFDAAAPASGSGNAVTVFLRGIGQTDFNLTVDPGVGIYVDGVYVSRSIGALLETTDIASVQVLRGPQGTLFGKNTIGGAVVVDTRAPTDEFEGSIQVVAGKFERADASGWVSIPANDQLRFLISGHTKTREGYVTRLTDGVKRGDQDQQGGRIVADWDASDAVSVRVSLDGLRSREEGVGSVLLETSESAVFPVFNNVFLNAPSCFPPSSLDNPACYNSQFLTGSPDSAFDLEPTPSDTDIWGGSMNVNWGLGPFSVKSITAYRELDSSFSLDMDHSPLVIQSPANDYTQEQFSQELQLSGLTFDDRLQWILGLYYLKEKGNDENLITTSAIQFLSGGEVDNTSYAAFGQAVYDITDTLRVTVGGRFTDEEKTFTPYQPVLDVHQLAQVPLPPGSPLPFFLTNPLTTMQTGVPQPVRIGDLALPNERGVSKASEFTPSLTLDYQPAEDVLLYATYAEGFKSGGFTQRVFPPEPVIPSFEPEFAEVLEIGAKTEWFSRRLRLNGALFTTDYTNLQIIVNDGIAPKVQNAGEARIRGVELEFEALPTEWLRLTGGFSHLDAKYREVDLRAFPVSLDSQLVNTPEWSASLGATATAYKGEVGSVVVQADWSYTGDVYKDAVNTPALKQDGFHLFGASATYTHSGEAFSATLGVTNLSDERYLVTGLSEMQFIGMTYGVFSRPREWYLRLAYRF